MQHFVIARPLAPPEVERTWPWLRLVPSRWRRAAEQMAGPKVGPTLVSVDGSVAGHALDLCRTWAGPKVELIVAKYAAQLSPTAMGWLAPEPPPEVAGVAWRTGRLYGLLAALSFFAGEYGPFGKTAALGLALIGPSGREIASAARFLARRVRHLAITCAAAHFRDRLAWQILTECGLAVTTMADSPPVGWDVAIHLGYTPPLLIAQGQHLRPRSCFPAPLVTIDTGVPNLDSDHPVWSECHLACLPRAGDPPLPREASLKAMNELLALSRKIGLAFSLA